MSLGGAQDFATYLFSTLYTYLSESTYTHNFRHLTPSIVVNTDFTMEAKPTPGKFIQSEVGLDAITDLATEFLKPEKLIALLQKGTTTITDLANEFLKPEKLKSYIQDYKSLSLPNILPFHTVLMNL
jgi:hypothetical protein